MKVLFLTKGKDNPATRYRVGPIAQLLQSRGDRVEIINEPGVLQQLMLIPRLPGFDVVFIQRKLFSVLFAGLLARLSRRLVFDFDDAIYLRSNGEVSRTRKRRFDAIMSGADLVLAGNAYLASAVTHESVRVVPTSVPLERYPEQPQDKTAEPVTLVWIGSQSTSRYLHSHRQVLEAIGERFPDIRLRIIGDFEAGFGHLSVENVPWREDNEVAMLMSAHIGIAPMVDDAWTRGKCALKVIQYMAAGLPVISSGVGANAEVVVEGETGFLVNSESEWLEAVTRLKDSAALRREMGRKGRARAASEFATDHVAAGTVAMLDQLSGTS